MYVAERELAHTLTLKRNVSMNIYTIYKATNKTNGKCYIGFDSNWPNRKVCHKSSSKKQNSKFYNAIRKHNWDNFVWEIIYQSYDGHHTIKFMEPYFIKQYNSFHCGYNSTLGGDGVLGHKHSEESKEKIKIALQGKKHSKDWCDNMSKSLKGKSRLDILGDTNPMRNPIVMSKRKGENHPKAVPIKLNGISYGCKRQAMKELNLSKRQLNKLLSAHL